MQKVIQFIKGDITFILFLFVFSWVFTLKNKIGFANSWDDFVFHPDTSFWVFIQALCIFLFIHLVKKRIDKTNTNLAPTVKKYLLFFGISLITYLLITNIFGILISLAFNTFSRNFNSSYQITYKIFNQVIDFTIFGSFSLAYLYSKENINHKKRLSAYEASNSKSKIQQLKAQLSPHFLFNNLNILDQLIDENKELASTFLSQFSDLYRYVLKNSNKELITIKEEIIFAENYFKLMETKYKDCYKLIIDHSIRSSKILIPPFCLQVLVENAIVHNLGTIKKPVIISISIKKGIFVTNNKAIHVNKKNSNGIALKNLSEQFLLLTNSSVVIDDSKDVFSVTLPLIKNINND
ncbi:sensor histidine kinase [Polaribacter sp. Asnod1-A03]|uniref:sensor histidine kinase n=1 Tax=Polaribacter sp. Asnod1-A03 TaxID=3160581 RepID=UPI00386B49C8